jgi:hypothetical protein
VVVFPSASYPYAEDVTVEPWVWVTDCTACGLAVAAAGYVYVSVSGVPVLVVGFSVVAVRFPVAGSTVYWFQYGAGPPNVVEDGAAVQEFDAGVHAAVKFCASSSRPCCHVSYRDPPSSVVNAASANSAPINPAGPPPPEAGDSDRQSHSRPGTSGRSVARTEQKWASTSATDPSRGCAQSSAISQRSPR